MFGTEHLFGSFEFETKLDKLDNGWWKASALNESAIHHDQAQAINDLNAKIDEKIQRGEIRPDMG